MARERVVLKQLLQAKAANKEFPMNQEALAKELGISPTSLNHKLAGRRDISLSEAYAMAKFLDMSLDLFYECYSYTA